MATDKTHVIAFATPNFRGYVRSLGRDGSWTATLDADKARRFTESAAAAAAGNLAAPGCQARFDVQMHPQKA